MSAHDMQVADTLASGSARSAVAEEDTLDSGGARGAQVEPGALPERIGRYNVLARLGSGAMGVVFSAHDPDLDRRVAVKLLHTDRGGHDSQIRLLREAQALARLSHRNVVQIHDTGAFGEQVFIAMELIDGVDLHSWLTGATRSADEVLRRFLEAGHGLAAAHDAGLVHRDFKPENVLVGADGRVCVADFGLACDDGDVRVQAGASRSSARPLNISLTTTGAILGTPLYMSPEQHDGRVADARSDQFSFCVALWEALYGRRPFLGETLGEIAVAVTGGVVQDPPADAGAALRFAAVLRRGLVVDPALRFPSMHALLQALAAPAPRRFMSWPRALLAAALLALVPIVWFAVAGGPGPALQPAPARSILVLPFATVGDETSDYFSAGVTEDITSMLARAPDITVLSNSAALAYKDQPTDARRIGSELGVAYVLAGTVRKEAGKVRIMAQLIDASTGVDVWSERFDRVGEDPWALQDEVAGKIVGALTGEYGQLKRAQYRQAWGSDSTNLDEYEHYLRGHELYMRFTYADNERAGAAWQQGLAAFPDSALLQAKLGFYHFMRPYLYLAGDAEAHYARAGALVRQALAQPHLSPLEGRLAHWLFAYVSAQEGDYERALREVETTMALAPYDAFQTGDLGTIHILAGEPEQAITMIDRAIVMDAANRPFYQQLKGWALNVAGRHAESITALNESIELPVVPLLQAINHARLGRPEQARAEVARALKLQPDLTVAKWRSANFYRDRALIESHAADLVAAGLP